MAQQTPYQSKSTADMSRCIDACERCQRVCLSMALNFCLEQGGRHAAPEHLRLMIGCAEVCRTAANLMLGAFPLHAVVCGACADICDRCADDCERVGKMDECVSACRVCAESCREMVRSDSSLSTRGALANEMRDFSGTSSDQVLTSL